MTALLTETTRDLTARLREALGRPEGVQGNPQSLRQLAWGANTLAGVTLSAWGWVRETLEKEGFEGRELAGYCEVLLEGIDGALAGYARLVALTQAAGLTPEAAGLRELEARLSALREARPKVAEMLALVSRPPWPVDEAKLAEARAALERGEFVQLDDDLLARLRAGEDL